jgi:hypothetical protein
MVLPDVGDGGHGMDQLFMQLAGTPVQPDHEASSTTTKMMVWRSLDEFSRGLRRDSRGFTFGDRGMNGAW